MDVYQIHQICDVLSLPQYAEENRKTAKEYTVAVCAIFKNESVFLKEWLEYHLLIGVEHFYLYNNFSEDNYQDILAPYIEKGQVTLTEWPVQFGQLPAYKDCFQKQKMRHAG